MLAHVICLGLLSAQAAATVLTSYKQLNRESSVEGCRLPDFPDKGRYIIPNYGNRLIVPGDVVSQFTVLIYLCWKNYDVTTRYSECQKNNTWSNDPKCQSRCTAPTSSTVDFTCHGPTGQVPCSPTLPSGATITSVCKDGLISLRELLVLTCHDGRWDYPAPECTTDCGLESRPSHLRLVVNGTEAVRGAFPWYVGIYRKHTFETRVVYGCGGTLLKSNVVIANALCVYVHAYRKISAYTVVVGEIPLFWEIKAENDLENIQKSKIKRRFLPENYEENQAALTLLELMTPVRLSAAVMPVCLDLVDEEFDRHQLEPGNVGKMVSWMYTEDSLETQSLRVVRHNECKQTLSEYNIFSHRVCAGYLNSSSLCGTQSGSALVFLAEKKDQLPRWYLRGVFASSLCPRYAIYLHIFENRDWISRTISEINQANLMDRERQQNAGDFIEA